MSRRSFGRVRKLPSGRWQARYSGPNGIVYPAPQTFTTKKLAEVWLSAKEVEVHQGRWLDPDGDIKLTAYVGEWIEQRHNLAPRTQELYHYLLRRHIEPTIGNLTIRSLTVPKVRNWHHQLIKSGISKVTAAKAYRLLRAALNTAVVDHAIQGNPCKVKGAGEERSPERPTITVAQMLAIMANIEPRYRVLVLLACVCGLRWGELAGLARRHLDLKQGHLTVERQLVEIAVSGTIFAPPKSGAGTRPVTIPAAALPLLRDHISKFVTSADGEALLFTSPRGAHLNRSNFRRAWLPATVAAGVPGLHFHDLRHTGNTWAAESGATLKELMERIGHASNRAALIYLHVQPGRDARIAAYLSEKLAAHLDGARDGARIENDDIDG